MSNALGAGAPSPQMDPNVLQRLMSYLFPQAQAAEGSSVNQAPSPAANPSPVDPRLAGGGPPVPSGVGLDRGGAINPNNNLPPGVSSQMPTIDPTTGMPTSQSPMGGPQPAMPYAGGQGPVGNLNFPNGNPIPGGQPALSNPPGSSVVGWAPPAGGGDTVVHAPFWPGGKGGAAQTVPRSVTVHPKRTTIPASATASVPAAGKSPFALVDAPNANPGTGGGMMGGGLARSGPSSRGQITALDLSKLFGGR